MQMRFEWRLGVVAGVLFALVGCGGDDGGGSRATPTAPAGPTATAPAGPTATATAPAVPTATAPAGSTATATPAASCDLPPPFCGGDFPLNTAMTTQYGPAWADVSLSSSDFLPCFGPYALCYYANCTVSADGKVSDCPCFEWFGPNFVVINAILNADSYQATVAQCTADPASCQVPNGAPVCADLNRGDFYANATRVSTFGFYRATVEPIGLTDCSEEPGPYAGCMTAPCTGPPTVTHGTATIHCDCPNWDGPFQLGKDGLSCDDAPMAWSAAYNPNPPPNACDIVPGGCIPDAPPGQCGCPLYTAATMLPPGSGVDCNKVCQEYTGCLKSGTSIQLGFTCDATLCTSDDYPLVFDACLGLQACDLSEIFKAEDAAECSCCASQLCNCDANSATEQKIYALDAAQRALGETTQCIPTARSAARRREPAAGRAGPATGPLLARQDLALAVELLHPHRARRRGLEAELAERALVEVLLDDLRARRRPPGRRC